MSDIERHQNSKGTSLAVRIVAGGVIILAAFFLLRILVFGVISLISGLLWAIAAVAVVAAAIWAIRRF